jgi:DNA modification methylase
MPVARRPIFEALPSQETAMKVVTRKLSEIRPYANNPRQNDGAVDAVAKTIQAFGFRQPIVIDGDGVIIVGHTRYLAAHRLGLLTVPVHIATGLTPTQIKAYRIADNQSNRLSDWDSDRLVAELTQLQSVDFDLGTLGFAVDDLAALLDPQSSPGLTDPDAVPEPPDQPITQPGDQWVLGNHRLLCGDSSRPDELDRLLDGRPVHLVNTDPPYNVRVEPRSSNAIAAGLSSFGPSGLNNHQRFDLARQGAKRRTTSKLRAKDRPLANDFLSEAEFEALLHRWFGNLSRVLAPGRGFYIWGGYANLGNYPPVLKAHRLYFSQAIVWDKQHPVLTRKDYMGCFELAFYGWKEGAAHRFFGPNNALDLWQVKKVNPQNMVHLTEKPTELAARAMRYSSRAGENVLDLFGGSGSTLIAAEQTGRNAMLMEIDAPYCDVIVQRWEQFTGLKAERRPAAKARSTSASSRHRGFEDVRNGNSGRSRRLGKSLTSQRG